MSDDIDMELWGDSIRYPCASILAAMSTPHGMNVFDTIARNNGYVKKVK